MFNPSIGCIIKTDSIGNKLWDSLYSFTTDILRILESRDSSLYLLSINDSKINIISTSKENSTLDLFPINMSKKCSYNRSGIVMASLTKTNSYGNLVWKKDLFLPNPIDLLEHSSGNIFVGGGLDSMILYKIDTSSSIIFQRSYYNGVNGLLSMCLSKEENVLLAGDKIVNNAFLMAVSKIEPNGNLIFNKVIPSLENKGNFAFLPIAVNSTNDYGFIFAGFTDYPPSFHESNFYATKTDSACNAAYIVSILDNSIPLPGKFHLFQNYPNPFNPVTTISYSIPNSGKVEIKVYDIAGREIIVLVNEIKEAGRYEIRFYGNNLASGVYFYKIESGNFTQTMKMLLVK